ncbi:sarcosine oxidase subunit delta [Rhizorhabdus dicambivorans]|uniref:Sarcosine oxidase subunit delta family protein n=1 Tax=Rhizorhabdus dicambivorans TaxID=1850238 RepID=A0A2A4FXM2_9SPHN|nr:sarcosine oxidase subunit delta [Rhizorhabdus dicambivorans]ATE64221.1 sarcosine oxidase subunit delta family protein [Rhizorhabdus dicambivorans]PCE42506.1 sarcosine oxidase subunit delta family protein [Rhizorhabdus dicambivorans]
MLVIECPFCGPRPEIEFRYAGEAHISRPLDPASLDDAAWAAYLYERSNPAGHHAERWHHVHGCRRYFNALRHTVTNIFSGSYPAGTPRPPLECGQ